MKSVFVIICGMFLLVLPFPRAFAVASAGEDSLLLAKKHFSFAVQYKKKGETDEALRQYGKSLAYCDTLYQVHFSLAELLMTAKSPERAKAEYLRTLALNPAHHPSAEVLAGMYTASARYDSALAMYEIMHRLQPDKTVLTNIARLRGYLGKNAEGLQAAQTLIAQGEDSPENLRLAAELAMKTGDATTADRFTLRALEKTPGDRELLRLGMKSALARGDSAKATEYLARISLCDSTDIAVLVELEDLCRARGDNGELIRALERHHRLAPRNSSVLGELAETCIAGGDLPRGEKYVRAGLELTPKDGRLHIILGELYRARGRKDQALAEYRTALSDPRWAETARQCISRAGQVQDDPRKNEKDFFGRGKSNPK
ncbi:MAG TPA: tetratricopeptide repeat protein [Armatimonadota bacterium]|nr:tetratricopeptide repeat protein [Armatimonadota bacterium]